MAKQNWNNTVNSFISAWSSYFHRMGVKKEDIIIDDIYNLGGSPSQAKSLTAIGGDMHIEDMDSDTAKVVTNIIASYDENIKAKEQMLTKSRELYETTAVQTIVDVSLDDGFNNFKEDKDFVISYEPDPDEVEVIGEDFVKEIQDEIDDFVDKSGIKDIVADIVPEIIRDGEHALALRIEQGKGITGINDDIDVINMLPYYRGNRLSFVLEKVTEETAFAQQEKVRLYNPDNIVFFRLKHFNKKKLNLSTLKLTNEAKAKFKKLTKLSIPKYIRICLPLYYSALDEIEDLQSMGKLTLAQAYANLLTSQVLGVGMPQNATSEDTKKALREYERHLNEIKNTVTSFKDLSMDDLINTSRVKKLLPLFSDGKGAISQIDVGNSAKVADSQDTLTNQKNQVALTTGYPTYYFSTTEQFADKATALKLYSRYTKKLSGLQVCIADGTEEIIYTHLKAKNKNVKRSNIKVKFKALTNGDVLDDIDVMVATVTGLADMYDALEKIASSENNELVIDSDKLQEVWDIYTSNLVNISGLLKKDPNKFSDGDFDSGDDIPGGGGLGSSSRERLGAGIQPSGAEAPEREETSTPEQETRIDRTNAESVADFENSTSAEL